eukprot:XP_785795.2 PREDICTED: zinc finger protein 37 [Strongylocentrotus purpuratus]
MESGDDVHYCLRCDSEIKGLMAYVEHRQSQCTAADKPSSPENAGSGDAEEDGTQDAEEDGTQDAEEDGTQEKAGEGYVLIDGEPLAIDPPSDLDAESSPKKRGRKRKATSPQTSPQRTPESQKVEERTADSPRRSGRRGIRISYADLAAGIDRSEARMSSDDGKVKDGKAKLSKAKDSKAKDKAKDSSPRKVGRPRKKEETTSDKQKKSVTEKMDEKTMVKKETVEEESVEEETVEEEMVEENMEENQTVGQMVKMRAFQEKNQKTRKNRRKLHVAAQKKLAAKKKKKSINVQKKEGDEEQNKEGDEEHHEAVSSGGSDGFLEDVAAMTDEAAAQNQEASILIKDGKFYCTVCRVYCTSKKKIDVHCVTKKHAKRFKLGPVEPADEEESPSKIKVLREVLECNMCSYRTKNEGHYARHLASISHAQKASVDLYACDKCHRKYKTQEELESHHEFHVIPRCGMCKETFETEELLETHRSEMGHKVENRCPECDKCFSNRGNLRNHMRIHNPDCKYKCDICEYSCVQWADMKKHKYRHMGFKPFKCGLCEAESLTKHGMERHMRTHLIRTKDYKCDICGKGYCEEYLMKQHKYMKHSLERRFPCDFEGCTYAFKFKSSLLLHQRMHTQEKPYLCADCGYKASTKYSLTKHIRLHTGEKPFHCDYPNCNYKCRLSTHLSRHKIIHTGIKPYHCPFCLYACNNKQNLRKHLLNTKSHFGLKMYKCKICPDYSTNVFRDYVFHIRQNHAEDEKYISYFEVAESVTLKNLHMAAALKNEENIAAEAIQTEEMMGEEDLQSFSVVTIVPGKKGGKKRNVTIMDDRVEVQKKLEQVILALEDHSAEVEAKAAGEAQAGHSSQETESVVPIAIHGNNLGDYVGLVDKELALGKDGETIVIVPEVENETEVCTTETTEAVVPTGEGGEAITQFVVEFDQQGRLVTEEDLAAATWLHNMGNIQDVTVEIQEEAATEEVQG